MPCVSVMTGGQDRRTVMPNMIKHWRNTNNVEAGRAGAGTIPDIFLYRPGPSPLTWPPPPPGRPEGTVYSSYNSVPHQKFQFSRQQISKQSPDCSRHISGLIVWNQDTFPPARDNSQRTNRDTSTIFLVLNTSRTTCGDVITALYPNLTHDMTSRTTVTGSG